jgi:predicted PurR-regulated permease PerM
MLFEVAEFSDKFKKAFGGGRKRMDGIAQGVQAVQRYLVIKTITSALTGVLVTIGCWIIGLDFAMLWGLLAFALNYIPTIGSIVAAVPPILLAFIQLGPVSALLVTVLNLAVNFGVGNVMEPRMMGRGLGLSSLVVFLSLVFWGWIWGPMGMLLSVPLTVVVKIMFEYHEETRPVAVLLGPAVREKRK